MTKTLIGTVNPKKGTVSYITLAENTEPTDVGAYLARHYTRRGHARDLVQLGDRDTYVPHPQHIDLETPGADFREVPEAELDAAAEAEGAEVIYVMTGDASWATKVPSGDFAPVEA